jgi:hypothetical protein
MSRPSPARESRSTTASLRSSFIAWRLSQSHHHQQNTLTTTNPTTITSNNPDHTDDQAESAHWTRRLLKRGMSADVSSSRKLLRKSPPTSNSTSQHRQSAQVDSVHTAAASIPNPVLPTTTTTRSGSDPAANTTAINSTAYSPTVAGPPYSLPPIDHPAPSNHQPDHSVSNPRYSVSDHTPTDLLGQRFDSLSVINSFDAIAYGSQHTYDAQPRSNSESHSLPQPQPHTTPVLASAFEDQSPQRPPQPTHSSSTFSGSKSNRARAASRLEQSLAAAGRRMEDLSARAGDAGARSPRQRYSDEARETNKLKKKSGFSSFMNNLVGTPRKPTISAPENPVHVTHVGYDQNTGEFTVRPSRRCNMSGSIYASVPAYRLVSRQTKAFSTFCILTHTRAFPGNGKKRSKQTASPSRSRRKTHKLSSTWSHSTTSKTRSAATSRFITNSTMPGLTTALSSRSNQRSGLPR